MWGWSVWSRVWGWEGEDERGDGKDFFTGNLFSKLTNNFLSCDLFQNYCFILLFNFLSCLRNVGESNDFALEIYFNFFYIIQIFL